MLPRAALSISASCCTNFLSMPSMRREAMGPSSNISETAA